MCWLCVVNPMNSLDGGHEALIAAAGGDNGDSVVVSGANAGAGNSDLVNGLNTGFVIDTGIVNGDGEMVINYYFMQVGEEIDEFGPVAAVVIGFNNDIIP